jgi:hypothetical protein
VVTGHGEAGKAVVVSDTDVQPTDPQFAPKWSIWSADAPVVLPNGGARPDFTGPLIPEPWRVPRLVLTLLAYFNPPACSTPPTRPGRHRLPAHRPPARWRWLPTPTPRQLRHHPGLYRTASWRNNHDEPAVMVGVVIGAEHKGVPLRTW